MEESPLALAADLGATLLRVALIDSRGHIIQSQTQETQVSKGRDDVVQRLIACLSDMALNTRPESLVGVGISVASPVDPKTGVMRYPPNMPGWDGFTLRPLLEEKLKLQVSIANDATLAALAEHRFGAGRGYSNLIYMTISTGIGGGIIIDGDLYTGAGGFAGEIGHMSMDPDGPMCNCGNIGCLEALASGIAIARRAREGVASLQSSEILNIVQGNLEQIDAKIVARAARKGDPLAKDIMEDAATNIGRGIVSLLHVFDPEVVIVGGGLSQAWDILYPGIQKEITDHTMAHQRRRVPLLGTYLGDSVSLLGAAALAFYHTPGYGEEGPTSQL